MLNAGHGLIGKAFGAEALAWVNSKMSVINSIIPYIVFFLAVSGGLLWAGYSLYEWLKRRRTRKHRLGSLTDGAARGEVVDEIKVLLTRLSVSTSDTLSKTVELLDKLK